MGENISQRKVQSSCSLNEVGAKKESPKSLTAKIWIGKKPVSSHARKTESGFFPQPFVNSEPFYGHSNGLL
jgi:hypothetical protein